MSHVTAAALPLAGAAGRASRDRPAGLARREFLRQVGGAAAVAMATGSLDATARPATAATAAAKARIVITLDLEMSRHYPRRGMTEWDYQKGDLDEATKRYAVEAGRLVKEHGGRIHYFCVGRVLEQPDVDWLRQLAEEGHPVGNHTYDHVNLRAKTPEETQYRFRRAPWLVAGKSVPQVLYENITLTRRGLRQRAGIEESGFRTPGGFHQGLADREDLQKMLLDLGYRWVSSKYPAHSSGKPGEKPSEEVFADILRAQEEAQPLTYPSGLVELPMSPISDVTAFRSHFWKRQDFLEATRRSVEWAIGRRKVFDFLAHPSCLVVEDPEFETIRLICELVRREASAARLATLDQVAERLLPASKDSPSETSRQPAP